jgi:hypothetical protein
MFSRVKEMWKEARGDVVLKQATDILTRFDKLGGYERYELISAFDAAKDELEHEHGEFAGVSPQLKAALAQQFLRLAKEQFNRTPNGSCGAGLLGLYLEAQTLPGTRARQTVLAVEDWHRQCSISSEMRNGQNRRPTL